MPGKGLKIIATSRPVYSLAPNKLTFAVPAAAKADDIVLALLVHKVGEGFTLPAGWTSVITALGATNAQLDVIARVRAADDSNTLAVALLAATDEWQGQMIALRGGSIPSLVEGFGSQAFAADATPDAPGSFNSEQAINLAFLVVSGANNIDFGTNGAAGFTQLEEYNTAVVSSRTLFIAWRRTLTVGSFGIAVGHITANPAATGRTFLFTARERPVVIAAELVDPVPGNIGLLGR